MRRCGTATAREGSFPAPLAGKAWMCRLSRPRRPLAWRGHPSQAPPCSVAPTSRGLWQQATPKMAPPPRHHEIWPSVGLVGSCVVCVVVGMVVVVVVVVCFSV